MNTVLRAHGIAVRWERRGNYREPTPECLEAFRNIDIHWHDLRREYASRLVEKGVPLAQVRDLLGHASITTTERYDNQTVEALRAAAARLEAGKAFEPRQTGHFQDSFKRVAEGDQVDHTAIEPNELNDLNLSDCLGGRESLSRLSETSTNTGVFRLMRFEPAICWLSTLRPFSSVPTCFRILPEQCHSLRRLP